VHERLNQGRLNRGRLNERSLVLLIAGLCIAVPELLPGPNHPYAASLQTPATPSAAPPARAFLNQYCVTCHNTRLKTSGLALDDLDPAQLSAHPEIWEKVVRKLRTGAMPPQGARRADEATSRTTIEWLETELDRTAVASPNPGRPALHRLNRAEYANAIRDLLDLEVDVTSRLPPDDAAFGFDNIADVLGVPPVLLERYVDTAAEIAERAVGSPDIASGSDTYRVRQDLSQDRHIEGLPIGTVGGLAVRHTFPLDAEYTLQAKLYRTNVGTMRGLEYEHEVEISLDGKRVHLAKIGGDADLRALFKNENSTALGDQVDAPR
jgi:hypothetical protein